MTTKRSIGHAISKKVSQSLLQDTQWIIDDELSASISPSLIYRHPDGRIMYVSGGIVRLYEAAERELFIELHRQSLEAVRRGPTHMLLGLLPQGANFAAEAQALAAELPALLRLSPDELDYSRASVDKIEPKLKRRGSNKCLEAPLFPALVAYLGEIISREINGEWRMRLWKDNKTWEPWIVDKEGRASNPWIDLCDVFHNGPMIVGWIVNHQVGSRRLPPPDFWNRLISEN